VWAFLPETKGIPLEEMAKIFGDTDIAVYEHDIHVDHDTHELVVETHDGSGAEVMRVATEAVGTPKFRRSVEGRKSVGEKEAVEEQERVAAKV
jgi:hypothetical protein